MLTEFRSCLSRGLERVRENKHLSSVEQVFKVFDIVFDANKSLRPFGSLAFISRSLDVFTFVVCSRTGKNAKDSLAARHKGAQKKKMEINKMKYFQKIERVRHLAEL